MEWRKTFFWGGGVQTTPSPWTEYAYCAKDYHVKRRKIKLKSHEASACLNEWFVNGNHNIGESGLKIPL